MNGLGIRGRLAVLAAAAAVTAIGVPAAGAATIAPSSHNFGNVSVGGSSLAQTFTVTNGCSTMVGAACLTPENTPVSPRVSGAAFAVANLCPPALTTNAQTCRLNVTFTPTEAGDATGTVSAGGLTASLTGTGVATPTPRKCKKKKKGAGAAKKKCKKKKK
jgi:hypothetical protein